MFPIYWFTCFLSLVQDVSKGLEVLRDRARSLAMLMLGRRASTLLLRELVVATGEYLITLRTIVFRNRHIALQDFTRHFHRSIIWYFDLRLLAYIGPNASPQTACHLYLSVASRLLKPYYQAF